MFDRLGGLHQGSTTMADHRKAIILLDHVSREVAAGPQLHQRCGGATAHGVDFIGGEDGH
jgi:hypothetical protein